MSLPAPRKPRHDGGRWETIRYALDSNARTFRLCLIWLVVIAAPVAAAAVAELIRHTLLCGAFVGLGHVGQASLHHPVGGGVLMPASSSPYKGPTRGANPARIDGDIAPKHAQAPQRPRSFNRTTKAWS